MILMATTQTQTDLYIINYLYNINVDKRLKIQLHFITIIKTHKDWINVRLER